MNRAAELARARAAARLDEDQSFAWFGVGRATLERIEAGEVEPEPEIMERIDRFLQFAGGTANFPANSRGFPFSRGLPGPPLAHCGGSTGGGTETERYRGSSIAASCDRPAADLGSSR